MSVVAHRSLVWVLAGLLAGALAFGGVTHLLRAEEGIKPAPSPPRGPDKYALLSSDGRQVVITGTASATQWCHPDQIGQAFAFRATLTQPGSGAVGEGAATLTCTSDLHQYRISVTADGTATFSPGPAQVDVLQRTAAFQWLGIVTLVTALPSGATQLAPPPTTLLLAMDPTLGPVLTDMRGFSAYVNGNDPPDSSTCTGDCAAIWLPLGPTFGEIPPEPSLPRGVVGELSTITRGDGSLQLTYNHQPLYLYTGDNNPGDTNGQGVGGVWQVAAPQTGP